MMDDTQLLDLVEKRGWTVKYYLGPENKGYWVVRNGELAVAPGDSARKAIEAAKEITDQIERENYLTTPAPEASDE